MTMSLMQFLQLCQDRRLIPGMLQPAELEEVFRRVNFLGGGATTKIVVDDTACDKPNSCAGFNHPKRPLRRGSFRSSSFGGVGNRRGSVPVDVAKTDGLQKEWLKKQNNNNSKKRSGKFLNGLPGEDILYDIRNFSHLHIVKAPPKVSSGSQLMQKQSSFYGANGRRGSLPVEFTCMSYMR